MSIYLIWFLIGSGFLIAEFVMPTFIMFFFAIGAIIVSIVTACFDLSIDSQIMLFALSSVISLLLLRNYMKHIFKGNESKGEDNYFENTIDSSKNIGIVSKNIEPDSFGEIKYKGTFYKAQSDSSIDEGTKVRVVSKGEEESSFLEVEEIIN
jgi:membrane protein implicated in regulation of membrane protease activity